MAFPWVVVVEVVVASKGLDQMELKRRVVGRGEEGKVVAGLGDWWVVA